MRTEPKFKVGDKVRCLDCNHLFAIKAGKVYTVGKIIQDEFIVLKEVPTAHLINFRRLELIEPNHVLTPEEVFEHLRKGTKLQLQNSHSGKWYDVLAPEYVGYAEITTKQWRIKPEPEVIELNGKRYKLIEE